MRILYASERPPYPFFLGGAVRCAHTLLHGLSQDLATPCMAIGSSDYAVTPWSWPAPEDYAALEINPENTVAFAQSAVNPGQALPGPLTLPSPRGRGEKQASSSVAEGNPVLDCGYPVQVLPDFFNLLDQVIDAYQPDLVWAQLEGAQEVLQIARRKGVKGLYFVHDAEFDPAELRAIVDLGCTLVASSHFLAGKALAATGQRAHVVHPPMNLFFDTRGDAQGFVTLINAHKVKGLDTFLEVARRLPQVRFLLQESWKLNDEALAVLRGRLAELPNVTFQHRVSDMRQVYRQTRLLLAPSIWEEGFGMVAVEAQSCGIPVIASVRGGLPESVGNGGLLIKDYRNVEAWVAAVQSVLDSPDRYADLSTRALAHARSADFSPPELARRFLAACQAPAPGTGGLARGMRAMRRAVAGLRR